MKNTLFVALFLVWSSVGLATDSVGTFFTITPGDDVEGMVRITPAGDGGHVLTLSQSFQTVMAPSLFVVLHKETIPRSYTDQNAVVIGVLQSISGMQQYYIPPQINPDLFPNVIIWCKEFNVTFGGAKMMSISKGFI